MNMEHCTVGTREVPSSDPSVPLSVPLYDPSVPTSAYWFDRTTREGVAYLCGIDVELDSEMNAGTDFCGHVKAMLSVVSSAGSDMGVRKPWTAVKLETTECGIVAVKEGTYTCGSEAVALYDRYMGQVPRDLVGECAATIWNFKQFLRGEGFTWFSDDEGVKG